MIDYLGDAWAALSIAEAAGVSLAIAYVVLAIRQNILCWVAALASALIFMTVFHAALLYLQAALQIFYAAMAVYGWHQWRYAGDRGTGVSVHTWKMVRHVRVVAGIAAVTLLVGWIMSRTDAPFPYVEALITVAAIVTTFMMARKVLEAWIYWLAIDSISINLYLARELYLTALLFTLYLVLSVLGFLRWRRDYLAGNT